MSFVATCIGFIFAKQIKLMNDQLIRKYNIPGPRYTSYPTVPFWNKNGIQIEDWKKTAKLSFDESNDSSTLR